MMNLQGSTAARLSSIIYNGNMDIERTNWYHLPAFAMLLFPTSSRGLDTGWLQ
jgi:hypothetical protein